MPLTLEQLSELPSPFYRAGVKALIFDDQQRLLVLVNHHGEIELPGGGWEHDESLEACLAREIAEETTGELSSCSAIEFVYSGTGRRGWHVLKLVVRATLQAVDDLQPGDDMQGLRFIARSEFEKLNWAPGERGILAFAATIWRAKD